MKTVLKKSALFTLLVALMLVSTPAQAGVGGLIVKMKSGVKAGINFYPDKPSFELPIQGKMKSVGYHLGIASRLTFLSFVYVQPELLYNRYSYDITSDATTAKMHSNLFNVPVAAGLKFGPTRFYAGPVLNIYSSSAASDDNFTDMHISYPTWGYQAGVGLSIFFLDVDLRLNGLTEAPQQSFIYNGEARTTNLPKYNLMLSVGCMF